VGGLGVLMDFACAVQAGEQGPNQSGVVGLFVVLAMICAVGAASSVCILRLKAYPFCLIGCVALMLGGMPCLFAGTGVGIWALIVLARPEVRAAFR
jgi:hypothetical protein